jgi:hypothetical protein
MFSNGKKALKLRQRPSVSATFKGLKALRETLEST